MEEEVAGRGKGIPGSRYTESLVPRIVHCSPERALFAGSLEAVHRPTLSWIHNNVEI